MKFKLLLFSFFISYSILAQEAEKNTKMGEKLPNLQLNDLNGNRININELGFKGPVVISFWATWCSPCKKELNTINNVYKEWQEKTGVNLIAVSIDDDKTKNQVPIYVKSKAWNYLVLLDSTGVFKNAMGVNNVPHTFLIDASGNIVYSHNNYTPGDENILFEEILKLTNK